MCLDEGVKLSHRKGSEVCVFLFSFNQVALSVCVGACVCVITVAFFSLLLL